MTRRIRCGRLISAAGTFTLLLCQGCSDLVRQSVRDGVFSYISGGLSQSIDGGLQGLLNDLVTGGLFGIGTGTGTGGN
ncbi:MAG: hypothetical protein HRF43_13595 [Phycisphaerae bacterium]|jgi:hypothetical protein